ncbi:MAG: hypothetical protein SGBAC_004434 [Bacillariaceae sp.]
MDDIDALHNSISQLEVQVANVENERNYHATKAMELMSVVNSQGKHDTLVDKSLQIAELSMAIDKLKEQIGKSTAEKEKLLRERETEKSMLQEILRSIPKESSGRSYRSINSGLIVTLSTDEESSLDDDLSLNSKKALDNSFMQIKIYIATLETERKELKTKCKSQERRTLRLERKNEELQGKLDMLERRSRSAAEEEEPVEERRFDSLPAPPMTDGKNSDDNVTIDTDDSDGEYEDEDYGDMHDSLQNVYEDFEEELRASPRTSPRTAVRSKNRSGSMPFVSPTRVLSGKEGRRRKSDPAIQVFVSRRNTTRRHSGAGGSVSSLELDDGSIATQKASANLTQNINTWTSRRRGSDASHTSLSRSSRSLSNNNNNNNISRTPTSSILREYDSPTKRKKRAAGSTASPWRSARFLRKGVFRSSAKDGLSPSRKKVSLTPSQSTKRKPDYNKADSTPDLMSTPRRAAAKLKIQERRNATREQSTDSNKAPGSPRKSNKENSCKIKVKGKKGTYTGPMREDVPHGVGTVVFANGDTYIGNVVNGKLHGSGTYYYSNKQEGIDRGIWRNNDRIWQ